MYNGEFLNFHILNVIEPSVEVTVKLQLSDNEYCLTISDRQHKTKHEVSEVIG